MANAKYVQAKSRACIQSALPVNAGVQHQYRELNKGIPSSEPLLYPLGSIHPHFTQCRPFPRYAESYVIIGYFSSEESEVLE